MDTRIAPDLLGIAAKRQVAAISIAIAIAKTQKGTG
jgi:hypothetical protein